MWIILTTISLPIEIPSWTEFNIKLHKSPQICQSNIEYLDCLDAPATEIAALYYMLERSLRIKDQLELSSIVCVYEQAIYGKAFQIKCKEPDKFRDIIVVQT